MKTQILNILNKGGVHIPTVAEFEQMAEYLAIPIAGIAQRHLKAINAISLMQRWEELTRGKWKVNYVQIDGGHSIPQDEVFEPTLLKREQFVCEVENPINSPNYIVTELECKQAVKAYESAKEKVWFEGNDAIALCNNVSLGQHITVWNFINYIEREKYVEIKFTESFVNELIKQ